MTISVVQTGDGNDEYSSGTSNTTTVTFSSNFTSGNCLVLCYAVTSTVGNSSVTSVTTNGAAEHWTLAVSPGTANLTTGIWVNYATTTATNTIDVNWSFGGTASSTNEASALLIGYEISGIATSPVDKTSTQSNAGTTWTSGTTGTTTVIPEIFIGTAGESLDSSLNDISGPSSPWVNTPNFGSCISGGTTYRVNMLSGYNVVNTLTTGTFSGTSTTNTQASIVSLKGTPFSASLLNTFFP